MYVFIPAQRDVSLDSTIQYRSRNCLVLVFKILYNHRLNPNVPDCWWSMSIQYWRVKSWLRTFFKSKCCLLQSILLFLVALTELHFASFSLLSAFLALIPECSQLVFFRPICFPCHRVHVLQPGTFGLCPSQALKRRVRSEFFYSFFVQFLYMPEFLVFFLDQTIFCLLSCAF